LNRVRFAGMLLWGVPMIGLRVAICVSVVAFASAQPGRRLYPGARIDQAATNEARAAASSRPDFETTVYTTTDSFDTVYAFFKRGAREFKVFGSGARKLPNGATLQDAFFLLDEASSLPESKRWVKVQRPYIPEHGLARGAPAAGELRNITAIVLVRKK
jgi:hypothetical protein